MRATPVNLIGGFYADDTRPWSVQDTVNWLPVAAEVDGTLTPSKLSTPPGLRPYQKIGTGPIRGMYNCEGQMFVVSGRTMYRISNAGVGIPVGTIPGVGRVSISHNQFKGGNQVLVTNGSPGGGYVYDTQAQEFNRISDPGFPGSLMTAYVDSYLLGVEPKGRFWFHSNLADANDYNTLDRYEAEAAPDRIVGIAVSQFEVWTFGERTTECFGNTGGATGTFQSRRTSIERGCASRWTIQNLDNSIFWLGDDGIVYRLEGYGARRVSTVPLERAIASNRLQDAFAFTWEDKGHKVYYLTMADGHTWGYDVVSGIWHRRESYGLNRWRINDVVRWNGAWYGGDFQDGRIWRLDWEYPAEGDQPMVSERTSPVMHDAQSAFNLTSVELIMGVGESPVAIDGTFPDQPPIPSISGDAPDGTITLPWGPYSYAVSGGTPPYNVTLRSGSLPSGIGSLTSGGTITGGTPPTPSKGVFRIRATDSRGMFADLDDSIDISEHWYAVGALPGNAQGKYVVGYSNGTNWPGPVKGTGHGTTSLYVLSFAEGSSASLMSSNGTGAITNDRGVTWTYTETGVSQTHEGQAFGGGVNVVCCTNGIIAWATSSGVYTQVSVENGSSQSFDRNFHAVAYGDGMFIAVSDRSTISEDGGRTWSPLGDRFVSGNGVMMRCIAYGDGEFVSCGDSNSLSISKSGTSWALHKPALNASASIRVCAFSGGMWVIANSIGQIAYGRNPRSLNVSSFILPAAASAIHAKNGRFTIGTSAGGLYISTDGASWATTQSPFNGAVRSISSP